MKYKIADYLSLRVASFLAAGFLGYQSAPKAETIGTKINQIVKYPVFDEHVACTHFNKATNTLIFGGIGIYIRDLFPFQYHPFVPVVFGVGGLCQTFYGKWNASILRATQLQLTRNTDGEYHFSWGVDMHAETSRK